MEFVLAQNIFSNGKSILFPTLNDINKFILNNLFSLLEYFLEKN